MARTKQTARRTAAADDDEDSNDTQAADVDYGTGKVEERPSYVLRWQIWHKKNKVWNPFDPDKVPAAPAKEYPNSFFIVNIRYKEASAEPQLVISNWSERLLNFMRAAVGNDFFSAAPEYPVASLFLDMKTLRHKFTRAGELVSGPGYIGLEDKVKEVEKLGFTDAVKPATSWLMCKTYLTELLEHLTPFMEYMDQQFAPVEEKLARLKEFGQMEFDLLPYHFEPDQKLVIFDCPRGRPSAFKLTSRAIESDWRGRRMKLRGIAYKFDGDAFVQKGIETEINEFKGTRPAQELEAIHLTSGIEEGLTKRGRLYTSLSGVFHKDYKGKRVMLDPKAYANREGYDRDPAAAIKSLEDELLYLLPPDIEGFNLANKVCPECQRRGSYCPPELCQTWQMFDVTKVKDVVFDENAWEHLVLDADTKLLVESLVRVTTNTNTTNEIITDVISGKGGGLISVLHGPPGTGKTLTAESIAEHLRRPMYMMGFAELSTTADKLENNLRKILKLATAWDAVLLIDEADVFLEQRSLHELERNALVSVALRLLEYHRGVLFLTTNRIKTFDEAFLSRFSIAIKYNELDHAGRLAVWKKFFELAGCRVGSSEDEGFTEVGTARVSSEDLEELAEKPFNGRTIKNLVRTAQALALSHGQSLSADHVKTVVRVQEKFLREFANVSH